MANEPTLRPGDASADGWVEYLQNLLLHHGVFDDVGEQTYTNGIMDDLTVWGLQKFQREHGLESESGVCGDQSWAALRGEPEPQAAGTDGRDAHEYLERGLELRFGSPQEHVYFVDENQLLLFVHSVGDQHADEITFNAAQVKDPDGNTFDILPTRQEKFGNHMIRLDFDHITGDGPYGRYAVLAQLPQDTGGDSIYYEFDKVG